MPIIQGAITLLLFVFILGTLVILHELGHFVVARLAGIRVHEFGIGFPPRARVLRSKGETLYTLNWLPIGGFVRLEGEDGESSDPRSFAAARLRTKLVVLVAGVAMNLLLAFVIFFGIAWLATPQGRLVIGEVQPGGPAAVAGLVAGDAIESIEGVTFDVLPLTRAFGDARAALRARAGQAVLLGVRRANGTAEEVRVTLRPPDEAEAKGATGITIGAFEPTGTYGGHDLLAALGDGAAWTADAFGLIVNGLGSLLSSIVTSPTTAPPVTGPVGIAVEIGDVFWQYGSIFTLYVAGLLSANLALVNILPFPPLDGGRMLVLVLKAVLGGGGRLLRRFGVPVRGPSAATTISIERLAYLVGFVFLFGFLAWITFFDIARQLGGGGAP